MRIARIVFIVYLLILSMLLLIPNPAVVTGGRPLPGFFREHLTHFLLYTVLTILALAGRWPLRFKALLSWLAAYAVVMEGLQVGVPARHVSLNDLVENLLGIAAGAAIYGVVQRTRAGKAD